MIISTSSKLFSDKIKMRLNSVNHHQTYLIFSFFVRHQFFFGLEKVRKKLRKFAKNLNISGLGMGLGWDWISLNAPLLRALRCAANPTPRNALSVGPFFTPI